MRRRTAIAKAAGRNTSNKKHNDNQTQHAQYQSGAETEVAAVDTVIAYSKRHVDSMGPQT